MTTSRLEYQRRINRVLDHIDRHYGEVLSLEQLAAAAAFSPFHFHRVFRALVGQTVQSWVNRVRLERAAQCLVHHPERSVTEIALSSGFSTASNFARAFKLAFGQSATEYRAFRRSKISQAISKGRAALPEATSYPRNLTRSGAVEDFSTVEIRELPRFRVAYVRYLGSYNSEGLAQAWAHVLRIAQVRGLITRDSYFIGIPHDDDELTADAVCRYDACITVTDTAFASEQVNFQDFPGGYFAVWNCLKHPAEIANGWSQLFEQWLVDSGFEPAWGPGLERYSSPKPNDEGRFHIGYCIPLRTR